MTASDEFLNLFLFITVQEVVIQIFVEKFIFWLLKIELKLKFLLDSLKVPYVARKGFNRRLRITLVHRYTALNWKPNLIYIKRHADYEGTWTHRGEILGYGVRTSLESIPWTSNSGL